MVSRPFTPWIQFWKPKLKTRLRLFCFPYAGGDASIFRAFSEFLPADVEVWPVQLPGRGSRFTEIPFSRMDDLIYAIEKELSPYLDIPYAFFGHSMGALISFELMCALRRVGHVLEPVRLFVSAHRAPQLPVLRPLIHHLPELALIEELRRLKGTPEEVLNNPELLKILFPLLRADFTLCGTYIYKQESPFLCPITVFGGLQDEVVPRESILAWKVQTRGDFKTLFFAGDHFFLHKERIALLEALSQDLLSDLRSMTSLR